MKIHVNSPPMKSHSARGWENDWNDNVPNGEWKRNEWREMMGE